MVCVKLRILIQKKSSKAKSHGGFDRQRHHTQVCVSWRLVCIVSSTVTWVPCALYWRAEWGPLKWAERKEEGRWMSEGIIIITGGGGGRRGVKERLGQSVSDHRASSSRRWPVSKMGEKHSFEAQGLHYVLLSARPTPVRSGCGAETHRRPQTSTD